ncbi:MAG: hypothetical protein IPJ34_13450 [Myxococcales bacterium]|nr:hypothetical protein [Myxococcales bacterium]
MALRGLASAPPTLQEARDVFREALVEGDRGEGEDEPPVLFDTEEQGLRALLEKGHRMLNAFFDQVDWPDRVLDIELPFAIVLHHPGGTHSGPLRRVPGCLGRGSRGRPSSGN